MIYKYRGMNANYNFGWQGFDLYSLHKLNATEVWDQHSVIKHENIIVDFRGIIK